MNENGLLYFLLQNQQARIAALYLPLISIILENKHRFSKSDDKSPSHAQSSQPVVNGDTPSGKSESRSGSANHTPVQKQRSTVTLPLGGDQPSKRDSSVFDMIAGTKSEWSFYNECLTNLLF